MSSISIKSLQNSKHRRRSSANNSGQSSQETVNASGHQLNTRTLPPNSPYLHGSKRIPIPAREPLSVLLEDAIEQLKVMGLIGGHKKKSAIKSGVRR